MIELYTDGSCSGNPGPGGWGCVIKFNDIEKQLSGGEDQTTNNRMELCAVINGLLALKKVQDVTIYTDSAYVANAVNNKWLDKWKSSNWTRGGEELKNADLWQQLDELLHRHRCTFVWVKGHAGHKYNEICDQLATQETRKRCAGFVEPVVPNETEEMAEDYPEEDYEQVDLSELSPPPMEDTTESTSVYEKTLRALDDLLCRQSKARFKVERPCGAYRFCDQCNPDVGEHPCAKMMATLY